MSVNRKNFGKIVLGARAMLGLIRMDLASRANLGHETVARVERGEDGVSINVLMVIQVALEQAGVFFPNGTTLAAVGLLDQIELPSREDQIDHSMPRGARHPRIAG